MKYFTLAILLIFLWSCQNQPAKTNQTEEAAVVESTGNFGSTVLQEEAVPASDLPAKFIDRDTIAITVNGPISASCKHSGCWMDIDMGNGEAVHVTFLEEAFTIPLDAAGKNAIAQGVVIRSMIPVETLQNYAREEGLAEEEVAAITEPEWAYEMIAAGVLIEE